LYTDNLPSAEIAVLAPLATGAFAPTQFRIDDSGRVAPAGNTVKNDEDVGLIATTDNTSPLALVGMSQFPLLPNTVRV
jgi:hypothetical protein